MVSAYFTSFHSEWRWCDLVAVWFWWLHLRFWGIISPHCFRSRSRSAIVFRVAFAGPQRLLHPMEICPFLKGVERETDKNGQSAVSWVDFWGRMSSLFWKSSNILPMTNSLVSVLVAVNSSTVSLIKIFLVYRSTYILTIVFQCTIHIEQSKDQ